MFRRTACSERLLVGQETRLAVLVTIFSLGKTLTIFAVMLVPALALGEVDLQRRLVLIVVLIVARRTNGVARGWVDVALTANNRSTTGAPSILSIRTLLASLGLAPRKRLEAVSAVAISARVFALEAAVDR